MALMDSPDLEDVLGTIGGYMPGELIGPAYGATYILAKTENTAWERHIEEDAWVAAAEWAFHEHARKPGPGRRRGRPKSGRRPRAGLLRPGGYREIVGAAGRRRNTER